MQLSRRGRARHQTGSIKPGSRPGTWELGWYEYVQDPVTGKEHRKHRTEIFGSGKTKKHEAAEELRKHVERVNPITAVHGTKKDDSVTLRWFVETRWKPMYYGNWREGSTENHNEWLLGFILDSEITVSPNAALRKLGDFALSELDVVVVQNWLNALAKTGGKAMGLKKCSGPASRSLVKQVRTMLRSFGTQAHEQDFLRKNPLNKISLPHTRKPDKTVYQWATFNDILARLPGEKERLIVKTGCVEGARPGELFGFRWRNMRKLPGGHYVLLVEETVYRSKLRPWAKTKDSEGYLALPAKLVTELLAWKKVSKHNGEDDFIFPNSEGGFIETNNFRNRVLVPLGKKIGLAKCNFQVLRRTFATRAYKDKLGDLKDIQTQLRHSHPNTTLIEYIQDLPESVFAMVDAMYAEIQPRMIERNLAEMNPVTERAQ